MENGVAFHSMKSAISLQALGAAPSILAPLAPLRGEGLGARVRCARKLNLEVRKQSPENHTPCRAAKYAPIPYSPFPIPSRREAPLPLDSKRPI